MQLSMPGRAWFTLVLAVILFAMLIRGMGYESGAWIYPVAIGTPTFILVLVQLSREIRGLKKKERIYDVAPERSLPINIIFKRAGKYLAWILGLYGAIALVGFKIGFLLFFIFFLKIEGHRSWLKTLIAVSVAVYLIMVQYEILFGVHWPGSLLEAYIKLPF